MRFVVTAFVGASCVGVVSGGMSVASSDLGGNSVVDLAFVNRAYVPYGPDQATPNANTTAQPWTGYGYGTGATEHFAYDTREGYVYSQSEIGAFVTVIDWCDLPGKVSEYSLDLSAEESEIKDVKVCSEQGLLFTSMADAGMVMMFETVKRTDPRVPRLLSRIDVKNQPDALAVSDDCEILAVANQNEGVSLLSAGALTIVRNLRDESNLEVRQVNLGGFTDEELLAKKVHMPLTQQAMKYWNTYSKNEDLVGEWDDLVTDDGYDPAYFLDPEFIAFNHDNSEIYLNLQDNSAIARVDVESAKVTSIEGMGLKSFDAPSGVDIVKDGKCELVSDPLLYATPAPDGIATVNVDGVQYIFTADEGSDLDFGDYEEKMDSNDLFDGDSVMLEGFSWAAGSPLEGLARHLNNDCDEDGGDEWCSNLEITIGSSAVDYSDESSPVMERIVAIGGRGMSVLRVDDDSVDLVWQSADEFEKKGCEQFPWAHNGLQDEEFAPLSGHAYALADGDTKEDIQKMNDPAEDGCEAETGLFGLPGACPMSKTVDEKAPEDGLGVEAVVVGVACSTLVAVACGENNSNCYLYDVSNPSSPSLLKVFNLSPASQYNSPGYAYDQKRLGDIDAESIIFVQAQHSPTGRDGVLFGGAISGTLSFYEFQCATPVDVVKRTTTCSSIVEDEDEDEDEQETTTTTSESKALGTGPIVGIVVAALGVVLVLGAIHRRTSKPSTENPSTWIDKDKEQGTTA